MKPRIEEQRKSKRQDFPLGIVLSLVFLILGVAVVYALLVGGRAPEPRTEPIIIRPENFPSIVSETTGENSGILRDASADMPIIGPISGVSDVPESTGSPAGDQFSDPAKRAAAYKANNAALRKTVDRYAKTRENHCAGKVTVQTADTPLNVRSGPSTGDSVLTKAAKGSKQSVLLWASDIGDQSARWFLLVDDGTKTVKGWVSGEYCETSDVVFAK
ncbi:MAG: SH3 domain-containing protein [Synergistaceae bacterium]|jgi:hypothetical protein|nr:SH3 domain-containing protein [Synergistaceae bacterium]